MLKNARKKAKEEKKNQTLPQSRTNSITNLPSNPIDLISSLTISNSTIEKILYNENFINIEDEIKIIKQLEKIEFFKSSNRSIAILGGVPHFNGAIIEKLPTWIYNYAVLLKFMFNGQIPNQVLINKYDPGQGIAHHCDGDLYLPFAAIISLGSSSVLEFKSLDYDNNNSCIVCSTFLSSRSLVGFTNDAYTSHTHGINGLIEDEINNHCINIKESNIKIGDIIPRSNIRYSMTFRCVKTIKAIIDDEFGFTTTGEKEEFNRRQSWWLNSIDEKKI
jgi:hypothetical protein